MLPNLASMFSVVMLFVRIYDRGERKGEDLWALAELRRGRRLRLMRSLAMWRVSWNGYCCWWSELDLSMREEVVLPIMAVFA